MMSDDRITPLILQKCTVILYMLHHRNIAECTCHTGIPVYSIEVVVRCTLYLL